MKNYIYYLLLAFALIPQLSAQSFPMGENAWSDPDFQDRFLGSYGTRSEVEPKITEADGELFNSLIELMQADQTQQAISQLTTYLNEKEASEDDNKQGPSAALYFTLGNLKLQEDNIPGAIPHYKKAIDIFPNFLRAYKNLGLAYLQNRQFEESIPYISKALELGDRNGDTFGLLGYAYLNTGDAASALEGYRQAVLLNPKNKEWEVGKAEALMRVERYQEAVGVFRSLIEKNPKKKEFYTSIANAKIALGNEMGAAYSLEIGHRQGLLDSNAVSLLGDIYINNDLPRLALIAYKDALEASAKVGSLDVAKAFKTSKALLARQLAAEAGSFLEAFEKVSRDQLTESEKLELLNINAQLALSTGKDDKAASILEKVIESDPLNGNALLLLGKYNLNLQDLESAQYYFDRAATIDGTSREATLELARISIKRKDYRQAIIHLENAQREEYSQNVQDFLEAVRNIYERQG